MANVSDPTIPEIAEEHQTHGPYVNGQVLSAFVGKNVFLVARVHEPALLESLDSQRVVVDPPLSAEQFSHGEIFMFLVNVRQSQDQSKGKDHVVSIDNSIPPSPLGPDINMSMWNCIVKMNFGVNAEQCGYDKYAKVA